MDPLTQGIVGAVAAQLVADKHTAGKAALIGGLSGMAPDLDVLIRSSNDSLLALEYHRHFTHALLFIPIGGGLCGLLFYTIFNKPWQIGLRPFLWWSVLGFATHGLLDACTSYGTRLLWPFSDYRVAWDLVSVIDPVFSITLLAILLTGIVLRKKWLSLASLGWLGLYLSIAFVQHQRALSWAEDLARGRGHPVKLVQAKPSFANIVVWKTLYQSGDTYFVDAVKPGLFEFEHWPGEAIKQLDLQRDLPWLDLNSQQAEDIERFRHFSAGFVALDPHHPYRIGDVRYSQLPQEIKPLWGIEVSPEAGPERHARYVTAREDSNEALSRLLQMIF